MEENKKSVMCIIREMEKDAKEVFPFPKGRISLILFLIDLRKRSQGKNGR